MRYRPIPTPVVSEQPIGSINTTPLIDVLLVLLIMFIMIIPVTGHKVPLELPQGPAHPGLPPAVYRLDLDAGGALRLNGAPVQEADLPRLLAPIAVDPSAELHLRADASSRYVDFDRVLAGIERAGVTRLGLVDNERLVEQ